MKTLLGRDGSIILGTSLSAPNSTRTSPSNSTNCFYHKIDATSLEGDVSALSAKEPQWASRTRANEMRIDVECTSDATKYSTDSGLVERERSRSPNRSASYTAISSAGKDSTYADLARAGGFRRHYLHLSAATTGVNINDRPVCWSEPLDLVTWSEASPYINFGGLRKSERISGAGNSVFSTAVAIFKAMVCSGITFTPAATAQCGWMFALVIYPCLAAMCVIGVQLLTHCMKLYDSHRSYADLAHSAFGIQGRYVVYASIVLSQSAFCSIYLLFVAESLPLVLGVSHSSPHFRFAEFGVLVLQTAFFVPMSWMQQVRHLNVVNEVGSAGIMFGILVMISLFSRLVYENGIHPQAVPFEVSTWPVFIGVAGYTFEGIAAILPIYQAMDDSKKDEWPLLFASVIAVVCLFLVSVGVAGYCAVGPNVHTVALQSLPDSWLKTVTQLVYLLALICSFPMQFFPVPVILEAHAPAGTLTKENSRALRSCFVCMLSTMAYICRKHLGELVEVVGAVLAVPLMIVFPAAIHLRLRGLESFAATVADVLLILVGVAVTVICTVVSINR
eukprot:GEMP01033367.1.p1 GENE.GEMP01033367.1~~GEMP01033367.1.p1  ORF type:complete len:561 (+),score=92.52 GEMP01033367.1:197-1879(+)